MSIHMLYVRSFILSSGYAAHGYLQLSLVQVPSSFPLVCSFHFMKLPKISEANINLVERNVLVPPTTLHGSRELNAVNESLLFTAGLPELES